jgi:hypothetical protein
MPSSLLQVVNSLFQTCYNKLGTSSANTTCRQLVNRFVTTCLQTCYNLCVFTCVLDFYCTRTPHVQSTLTCKARSRAMLTQGLSGKKCFSYLSTPCISTRLSKIDLSSTSYLWFSTGYLHQNIGVRKSLRH